MGDFKEENYKYYVQCAIDEQDMEEVSRDDAYDIAYPIDKTREYPKFLYRVDSKNKTYEFFLWATSSYDEMGWKNLECKDTLKILGFGSNEKAREVPDWF